MQMKLLNVPIKLGELVGTCPTELSKEHLLTICDKLKSHIIDVEMKKNTSRDDYINVHIRDDLIMGELDMQGRGNNVLVGIGYVSNKTLNLIDSLNNVREFINND